MNRVSYKYGGRGKRRSVGRRSKASRRHNKRRFKFNSKRLKRSKRCSLKRKSSGRRRNKGYYKKGGDTSKKVLPRGLKPREITPREPTPRELTPRELTLLKYKKVENELNTIGVEIRRLVEERNILFKRIIEYKEKNENTDNDRKKNTYKHIISKQERRRDYITGRLSYLIDKEDKIKDEKNRIREKLEKETARQESARRRQKKKSPCALLHSTQVTKDGTVTKC